MSPATWQELTCLPVVLCETCEDVAAARDGLCRPCRAELRLQSELTEADREIERFLAAAHGVAW